VESVPDTLSKVIHQRGKRSRQRAHPKLVNNFAAGYPDGGEQLAPLETRLRVPYPTRVNGRSPTPAAAPGPSAERTTPREGSRIRSHPSRGPAPLRAARVMNTQWTEQTYFAALDWAQEHHDVIVVDRVGTIVADFRFAHTPEGWHQFEQQMQRFGQCPMSIETSCGMVVDQLLQRQHPVYPVNPKAAKRYRERKAPSGTKTDRHDAWSLADALRTDGHAWRPLHPQDEATATLRLLCRDEIVLIEQRTALVNQLQAALHDYYPLAWDSFEDWTKPFTWAFVRAFPNAAVLAQAGKRRWEKFLHVHKLWRSETAPQRLARWARGQQLNAGPATVTAKTLLALSLVSVLESLQRQLDEYRRRITEAFAQHPDHEIFGSLPGAKAKLAPRLLAEIGSSRSVFPDADSLLCLAGVSPVSYQSGQICKTHLRWACNRTLRYTVHLWADASRKTCAWAQVYYQAKRAQGHNHASALRCLGKRWLKLLWRLWQNHTSYDESKHLTNLQKHGSFVWPALEKQSIPCAAIL
jgi:transposase